MALRRPGPGSWTPLSHTTFGRFLVTIMSIPDGYAVAPTHLDNLIRFAIPIPGRENPILVEMPPRKWMTPDEVRKYEDWIKPYQQAEAKIIEWVNASSNFDPNKEKPERPVEAEKLMESFNPHEAVLRWLKPYLKRPADYRVLLEKLPSGTVEWIKKQIEDPDISVGESSASSTS